MGFLKFPETRIHINLFRRFVINAMCLRISGNAFISYLPRNIYVIFRAEDTYTDKYNIINR